MIDDFGFMNKEMTEHEEKAKLVMDRITEIGKIQDPYRVMKGLISLYEVELPDMFEQSFQKGYEAGVKDWSHRLPSN